METNIESTQRIKLAGSATYRSRGDFRLSVTDSSYSADRVKKMLENGDITFEFGDTVLFDNGADNIANIEWDLIESDALSITFCNEASITSP